MRLGGIGMGQAGGWIRFGEFFLMCFGFCLVVEDCCVDCVAVEMELGAVSRGGMVLSL